MLPAYFYGYGLQAKHDVLVLSTRTLCLDTAANKVTAGIAKHLATYVHSLLTPIKHIDLSEL